MSDQPNPYPQNPHYNEEFPDGSLGGFAFTFRNCQRNSHHNLETLYTNLVLAIKQIDALKAQVTKLDPHTTYLPGEGLTYTEEEFALVINYVANNQYDIRLHQVIVNQTDHSWTSNGLYEKNVDGYRMFLRLKGD